MRVDETSGQRFNLALERMEAGDSLEFREIVLFPGSVDGLECAIPSSWLPENATPDTAREDLARAKALFQLLLEQPEFRDRFGSKSVEYVLIHNYGMGTVTLCREVGEELKWAHNREPRPW